MLRSITTALVFALIIAVAPLPAAGTGAVASNPTAGAQARLVNAIVHTSPERPDPGDDITVEVGVTGCPSGPVTVEIYLTTDDGAERSATLITRASARTTLLFRVKARLDLPAAIEGWYGTRVLCGTYRPPRDPMANTLFSVGIPSSKQLVLSSDEVAKAATVVLRGTGCPSGNGATVEYDVTAAAAASSAFAADGTVEVQPDGTWTADVAMPAEIVTASSVIRARCITLTEDAVPAYVYYEDPAPFTVTP